jgi:hypothetical protein
MELFLQVRDRFTEQFDGHRDSPAEMAAEYQRFGLDCRVWCGDHRFERKAREICVEDFH